MPPDISRESSALARNRAEELGFDVWSEFVVPHFFSEYDFSLVRKPRIIIGGRGCGKTMLLRYLSHYSAFSLQRDHIPKTASEQIGLYWKVDTHFTWQLASRGLDEDIWRAAFDHFLAITLSKELVTALSNVAQSAYEGFDLADLNRLRCKSIQDYDKSLPSDVQSLAEELASRLRQFQVWVSNPRKLEQPLFLPGKDFVLTLIHDIKTASTVFADSVFFAFIDEYENLREYQQELLNTYIKHSEAPLIFNIAIKRNGMGTIKTVSDESITNIADYRTHDLDHDLLKHHFDLFAAEVLFLRLANRNIGKVPVDRNQLRDPAAVELRSTPAYMKLILDSARSLLPGMSQKELAKQLLCTRILRTQLLRAINDALQAKQSNRTADEFILDDFPEASAIVPALLRRSKITPEIVLQELARLKNGDDNKFTGSTDWIHNNLVGCILQAFVPYDRTCEFYAGFDTFIKLANGNLRHFLELCYKSLRSADFTRGADCVSVPTSEQAESAREASIEFLREIRAFGRLGNKLHAFVLTLGQIFALMQKRLRQSEPEINHFSIVGGTGTFAESTQVFFNEAVKWSVLTEFKETKIKGDVQVSNVEWVLAPIYAPYFKITYRKIRRAEFSHDQIVTMIDGDEQRRKDLLTGLMREWKLDAADLNPTLFSYLGEE